MGTDQKQQRNGTTIYTCSNCDMERNNKQEIETHIIRMRPETRKQKLNFPYFPATFCNIGNMNVHFKKKRCANDPGKTDEERWGDISKANKPDETTEETNRKQYQQNSNKSTLRKWNYS